jgi:hypothetical protein
MTDGASYTCANAYHEQQPSGFCKISVQTAAPSLDNFDPLIAAHAYTCIPNDVGSRPGVFVCSNNKRPSTSTSVEIDSLKLPIFCIVLNQWIDDKAQTVIVPKEFQLNEMKHGQYCQTSSSIWRCTGADSLIFWQYRDIHVSDVHNWSEFTFNLKMGPFLNLSQACGMRDFFNNVFRDITVRPCVQEVLSEPPDSTYVKKLMLKPHIYI